MKNKLAGLVIICLVACFVQACGEETVCDKAREIQKRHCEGCENCFPCACVLQDKDWTIVETVGLLDPKRSSCTDSAPCEGQKLEMAKACIEDETTCNPRYWGQTRLVVQSISKECCSCRADLGFEDFCNPYVWAN